MLALIMSFLCCVSISCELLGMTMVTCLLPSDNSVYTCRSCDKTRVVNTKSFVCTYLCDVLLNCLNVVIVNYYSIISITTVCILLSIIWCSLFLQCGVIVHTAI